MNHTTLSFTGEYEYSLDQKNRLIIPAKFRKSLSSINDKTFVLTKGLDNCLFIYTIKEWNKLSEKLANLPFSQAKSRAFSRMILAGAMDVKVDKQGRIILPDYLKRSMKRKNIALKLLFYFGVVVIGFLITNAPVEFLIEGSV